MAFIGCNIFTYSRLLSFLYTTWEQCSSIYPLQIRLTAFFRMFSNVQFTSFIFLRWLHYVRTGDIIYPLISVQPSLRQFVIIHTGFKFSTWPRLTLKFWYVCFHFPRAGNAGVCSYTWLKWCLRLNLGPPAS